MESFQFCDDKKSIEESQFIGTLKITLTFFDK